tara:strand:- start:14529 stop:15056 length:528 start_codon:yes stop_codon:yes gene_type:complete
MNKTEIKNSLERRYLALVNYINGLSNAEFTFSYESKWTAGQHLKHIVLCVNPLVQVFGMPNTIIEQNFGTTKTESRTYDELLAVYIEKLNKGGKAPSQYVPEIVSENEKSELLKTLPKLIEKLNAEIDTFTENELDTLCIPHPLLGNISLREMLYNAIYHVEHHQILTENNLTKM